MKLLGVILDTSSLPASKPNLHSYSLMSFGDPLSFQIWPPTASFPLTLLPKYRSTFSVWLISALLHELFCTLI